MEVYVDDALVTTWTSSGTTDGFESIDLSGVSGEVIEVTGVLANSEWLSIVEVSPKRGCSAGEVALGWYSGNPCFLRKLQFPRLVL